MQGWMTKKKNLAMVPFSDKSAGPDSPCNCCDHVVFQSHGFKNRLKLHISTGGLSLPITVWVM
jgi:hypothetical protein